MGTDLSCGVVPVRLMDGERQYLLVRHNAGHWAFPKGHPEAGESRAETARRELAEETGLAVVDLLTDRRFEERYRFTSKSGETIVKTVEYLVGRVASDAAVTVQEEELSDSAWGSYDETRLRLTFIEGRTMLDEVEQTLAVADVA